MDERQVRVAEAARSAGGGWAVLTSPDPVCYATGFEVPYEVGPSPFSGGPATALVAPDGTAHLVVVNTDLAAAEASRAASAAGHEGFSAERPLHGWTEHAGDGRARRARGRSARPGRGRAHLVRLGDRGGARGPRRAVRAARRGASPARAW